MGNLLGSAELRLGSGKGFLVPVKISFSVKKFFKFFYNCLKFVLGNPVAV